MIHYFRWVNCNRRDYPLMWMLVLCPLVHFHFFASFFSQIEKKSTSFFQNLLIWYKEAKSNIKINLTSLMHVSMLLYIYLCFSLFRLLTHYQILVSFYVLLFISHMHTVLFKRRHLKRYMVTIFFSCRIRHRIAWQW